VLGAVAVDGSAWVDRAPVERLDVPAASLTRAPESAAESARATAEPYRGTVPTTRPRASGSACGRRRRRPRDRCDRGGLPPDAPRRRGHPDRSRSRSRRRTQSIGYAPRRTGSWFWRRRPRSSPSSVLSRLRSGDRRGSASLPPSPAAGPGPTAA
jgi:hypothetical protein